MIEKVKRCCRCSFLSKTEGDMGVLLVSLAPRGGFAVHGRAASFTHGVWPLLRMLNGPPNRPIAHGLTDAAAGRLSVLGAPAATVRSC
jgi:hypothetical protein